MRLKHFRGPSVADALAAVRREFGADALILATRRAPDGVEITAAIETETAAAVKEAPVAATRATPPPWVGLPPVAAARRAPDRDEMLRWHRVPLALADRLAGGGLEEAIGDTLRFAPIAFDGANPALVVLGPPGAGKTATVARLATRLVLAGGRPVVISADEARAGAREQLRAFTRVLGLELLVAEAPASIARAIARTGGGTPVLIDGPPAHPFDAASRGPMQDLLEATGAEAVLAMPAGLDLAEAGETAGGYVEMGARRVVATRLDLARRLGSVLGMAHVAGLALAELGIGPAAAEGLIPASPAWIANRLNSAYHEGHPS